MHACIAARECVRVGDLSKAKAWLASASSIYEKYHLDGEEKEASCDLAIFGYSACFVDLADGEIRSAIARGPEFVGAAASGGWHYIEAMARLIFAQALILGGETTRASKQLDAAEDVLNRGVSEICRFSLMLLRAELNLRDGAHDFALTHLTEALALGRKTGAGGSHILLPQVFSRLCAFALENRLEPCYVHELIRLGPLPPPEKGGNLSTIPLAFEPAEEDPSSGCCRRENSIAWPMEAREDSFDSDAIPGDPHEHASDRPQTIFANRGQKPRKDVARPARVAHQPASAPAPDLALAQPFDPPRRSIIVLPFENMSDDPSQDYFVDGVTESLTTDLSCPDGMVVIGRNTAFTYKGNGCRSQANRTGVERSLRPKGKRSALRQSNAGQCQARRRRNRQSPVGGTVRQDFGRSLRDAG